MVSEQLSVGSSQWAVVGEHLLGGKLFGGQLTMGRCQWAVDNEKLPVGSWQRAVGS